MISLQTKIMAVQGRKSGKITMAVKSEKTTCKWVQSRLLRGEVAARCRIFCRLFYLQQIKNVNERNARSHNKRSAEGERTLWKWKLFAHYRNADNLHFSLFRSPSFRFRSVSRRKRSLLAIVRWCKLQSADREMPDTLSNGRIMARNYPY